MRRPANPMRRISLLFALAVFVSCSPASDEIDPRFSTVESSLTEAQRRSRSQMIIDAARAKGITNPVILAGIAQAESGLSQCVNERHDRTVCEGPYSAECGGPVIAGYWDGPCAQMQGGLTMWQLDAGTYTDTLNHFGTGIVTARAATDAAIEFIITEKFYALRRSSSLGGNPAITSRQDVIDFLNKAKPGTPEYERYLDVIPGLYNGAWQGRSHLWAGRRAGYKNGIESLIHEFGRAFWGLDDPDAGRDAGGAGVGPCAMDAGEQWQCLTDSQGRAYRQRCFAGDTVDREYCTEGCVTDSTSGAVCTSQSVISCARQDLGELWACDDSNNRWRCISGRVQEEHCRGQCIENSDTMDDVCVGQDVSMAPDPTQPTCPEGWNPTWTCAGNELRRCTNGVTETTPCASPSRCVAGQPGHDDVCEAAAPSSDCPVVRFPSVALRTVVPPQSILDSYSSISGAACFAMPRCFLDTNNLQDEAGNHVSLTVNISPNFTLNEFVRTELSYGQYVLVSPELVSAVQRIRTLAGVALRVASGYRSPAHQAATCRSICPGHAVCCPSAPHPCGCKSRHEWGDAADLSLSSSQYTRYAGYSQMAGTPDCFLEAGSFHIDMSACPLGCPHGF